MEVQDTCKDMEFGIFEHYTDSLTCKNIHRKSIRTKISKRVNSFLGCTSRATADRAPTKKISELVNVRCGGECTHSLGFKVKTLTSGNKHYHFIKEDGSQKIQNVQIPFLKNKDEIQRIGNKNVRSMTNADVLMQIRDCMEQCGDRPVTFVVDRKEKLSCGKIKFTRRKLSFMCNICDPDRVVKGEMEHINFDNKQDDVTVTIIIPKNGTIDDVHPNGRHCMLIKNLGCNKYIKMDDRGNLSLSRLDESIDYTWTVDVSVGVDNIDSDVADGQELFKCEVCKVKNDVHGDRHIYLSKHDVYIESHSQPQTGSEIQAKPYMFQLKQLPGSNNTYVWESFLDRNWYISCANGTLCGKEIIESEELHKDTSVQFSLWPAHLDIPLQHRASTPSPSL